MWKNIRFTLFLLATAVGVMLVMNPPGPPRPPWPYFFHEGQRVWIVKEEVVGRVIKRRFDRNRVNHYVVRFFDKNWNLKHREFHEGELYGYEELDSKMSPMDRRILAPGRPR